MPALFAAKLTLSVGAAATEPEARRALMRIAAALGQFAVPAGAEFRIGRVRRSNQLRRKEPRFSPPRNSPYSTTVATESSVSISSDTRTL